ncbi:S8 family peptidase [Lachnospiraceae bacterium MD1]|jgi:subtilisin family serine protease|uniref:S8 family peptidase n=1 Tax=Variimorphobacter saccharofermentans TaxID=2755051 RepID=A0A839JYG5_9FIRM|nr:S8 family peptidase [Variimorphobacter saccharofermentans]MBB2181649.1 S8 family peptidase [Variimorphobacter saccharofermentans]
MTEEERFKITDNNFYDLLVEYDRNTRIFEQFPQGTPHIINSRFAVIYMPMETVTVQTIPRLGFFKVPGAYGLMSKASLDASGITRIRTSPVFNLRGSGVIIGILDTGIDYTNPVFIKPDGTSKIIALWDQTIESEQPPLPYFYGTEYLNETINEALASENPLEVVPSTDENGHGTMLAGIAVGNEDEENDFSGVVPDADLIVVKLKQMKQLIRDANLIPPDVPAYQENDLMWGIQYIVTTARRLQRPLSICIGMGSSLGAHTGRSPLGAMTSAVADYSGVVVTVAAGNEGNGRRHFFSTINPSIGYATMELNVAEGETGFIMEVWGAAPNTYSVDILSPSGEYVPRIEESIRVNRTISFIFERTQIYLDYIMVEPIVGDQVIYLRFANPTPGVWRFQVYSRGEFEGSVNAWLPIRDFVLQDTYFIQSNPYTTITSPGNAMTPMTVTAYNTANNNLYPNASRGYSRTGIIKPEFAAPGVNIKAPTLNKGFARMTGTGAAAAHTAGVAAMLLEWGIVRGNYSGVDTVEIKNFIIRGARRSDNLIYPNRDWGYGILDVFNVFDVLRSVI